MYIISAVLLDIALYKWDHWNLSIDTVFHMENPMASLLGMVERAGFCGDLSGWIVFAALWDVIERARNHRTQH